MFGILLRYTAKEQPGAKLAFVIPTEFGATHCQLARRGGKAGGQSPPKS